MPLILEDMEGFFTGSAGRSVAPSRGTPLKTPLTDGAWLCAGVGSGVLPSCECTEMDDVEVADDGAAGRDFGLAVGDMSVSRKRLVADSNPVSAVDACAGVPVW